MCCSSLACPKTSTEAGTDPETGLCTDCLSAQLYDRMRDIATSPLCSDEWRNAAQRVCELLVGLGDEDIAEALCFVADEVEHGDEALLERERYRRQMLEGLFLALTPEKV